MNTDDQNTQAQNVPQPQGTQSTPTPPISDLVSAMNSVDTKAPEANLNATSMSDNNGGRIEFNEDSIANIIK